MSRLTELISQLKSKDSQLGVDLEREIKAISSRREFGLNFEHHRPEIVELLNRKGKACVLFRGCKVYGTLLYVSKIEYEISPNLITT